ncbi:hypothetical protein GIB67_022534 [Kingdonia uniflora]|uniref:Auxin-responsive protein n=1 Tax=Kingdonia uniflora TaxID=39325 RepID=A0A7J7L7F8_9MAGN|nr:hypothetical protein GIB67_022534 [Kingdonia uniflora]
MNRSLEDTLIKKRWQQENRHEDSRFNSAGIYARLIAASASNIRSFPGIEDDLLSTLIPQVTVVLEGRSICQRISLHKHSDYSSFAKALHKMFVMDASDVASQENCDELDLSNAVPGHLVAYEDMEDDLLLAGDLNWKDFVRVAKRIRILPVKASTRKERRAT